jgi:hypothetical protein
MNLVTNAGSAVSSVASSWACASQVSIIQYGNSLSQISAVTIQPRPEEHGSIVENPIQQLLHCRRAMFVNRYRSTLKAYAGQHVSFLRDLFVLTYFCRN